MMLPEEIKLSELHENPDYNNIQYWYPFVNGNFKIELIYPSHKNPDVKEPRIRVFVRGDKNIYLSNSYKEQVFSLRLIKQTPQNSPFPRLFISNETFISQVFIHIWERFLLEMNITTSRSLDRNEIESNSITMKDIIRDNSENKDKGCEESWKMLSFPVLNSQEIESIVQRYSINENETQYLDALFRNFLHSPDDAELASLFNFSAIPKKNPRFYKFEPNNSIYSPNISITDIQQEISRIIIDSGIENSEEGNNGRRTIADKLKTNFNFDEYIKYNEALERGQSYELNKENLNMGSIIFGPPGTGKTETIERVFKPIFEDLFGFNYEMIEIDRLNEESQPGYYGARQRAVDYVFQQAFKRVQKNFKPCFVFVDEGDVLVEENRRRNDDNEGIAAMKNYLNINRYPGIILCICTNHDDNQFDEGIAQRRLPTVKYDYPPFKVAKIVWEENLKTHLFNLNIVNLNGNSMNLQSVSSELAKIVAGNLGLDTINTFCKNYSPKEGDVEFSTFKKEFFQQGYSRILTTRDKKLQKISQMSAFGERVDEDLKSRIKNQIQVQEENLLLAYNNRSKESSERQTRFNIKILQQYGKKIDNQVIYFIKYHLLILSRAYANNTLDKHKTNLKELYTLVNFLKEKLNIMKFDEQTQFILQEIINQKKTIEKILIRYCGDEAYDFNPKLLKLGKNEVSINDNELYNLFRILFQYVNESLNVSLDLFYTDNDKFSTQDLDKLKKIISSENYLNNNKKFISYLTFGLGELFSKTKSQDEFLNILSRIQNSLSEVEKPEKEELVMLIERTKLLYIIDKWLLKNIIIKNLKSIIDLTSSLLNIFADIDQSNSNKKDIEGIIKEWNEYKRILGAQLNEVDNISQLSNQNIEFLLKFLSFLFQNLENISTNAYNKILTEIQVKQRKNEISRIADICNKFKFNKIEEEQKENGFKQIKDFLITIINDNFFK